MHMLVNDAVEKCSFLTKMLQIFYHTISSLTLNTESPIKLISVNIVTCGTK